MISDVLECSMSLKNKKGHYLIHANKEIYQLKDQNEAVAFPSVDTINLQILFIKMHPLPLYLMDL